MQTSLQTRFALFPRADNHWFSRIRVANSLINSDFADFTALQAYTGSRSASRARRLKSLTNCRAPKQKDRRPRFPMIRFQARRLTRALKDRHDTGLLRGLSVENINDTTCEFMNIPDQSVRVPPSCPCIPFRNSRPTEEAHFAKDIHAFGNM